MKKKFKPFNRVVGLDLNLKNNFATLSNGYVLKYPVIFKPILHFVKIILGYLKSQNIIDVVIEDLNFSESSVNKYIDYSKLIFLSDFKNLFKSSAEIEGIRVHITPSCYTSITCPKCGFISKDNRKTQKIFKCKQCGYKCNADLNASRNLELRYTIDFLKNSLHNIDKNGRLIPKKLTTPQIKEILMSSNFFNKLPYRRQIDIDIEEIVTFYSLN